MTHKQCNKLRKIANDLDPAVNWGTYADKPKKSPVPQAAISKAPTVKQSLQTVGDHLSVGMDSALRSFYNSWAPVNQGLTHIVNAPTYYPAAATWRKIKDPSKSWARHYGDVYEETDNDIWDRNVETFNSLNNNIDKRKARSRGAEVFAEPIGSTLGSLADFQSVALPPVRGGVLKSLGREIGFDWLDSMTNPYFDIAYR